MVVLALTNLIGALVSFTYFTFVDYTMPPHAGRLSGAIGFFVVGFIVLAAIVMVWADRWARVLNPVDGRWPTSVEARRRALLLPYALAGMIFGSWVLSGLVFGVIRPLMVGTFTVDRALRFIFGNTFIAGTATTAVTFLVVEHLWRKELPKFFPEGDLSAVPRVFRLRVRTRLLVIFLLGGRRAAVRPRRHVLPAGGVARRNGTGGDGGGHGELARRDRLHRRRGRPCGDRAGPGRGRQCGDAASGGPGRHGRSRAWESRHPLPGGDQRRDRRGGRGLQSHGGRAEGARVPEGDVREVREPRNPRRDPGRAGGPRGGGAGGHHSLHGSPRLHALGGIDESARGGARPERLFHGNGSGHP